MARRPARNQLDGIIIPGETVTKGHLKYILPQRFELNNGVQLPAIGLGTYGIRSYGRIKEVVEDAIRAGYRSFDTAALYGNEEFLNYAFKEVLPKYNLERSDIFVTTKLSPCDYGGGELTENAFLTSLNKLGLDYIDLYLIHFPGNAKVNAANINARRREMTWATLTKQYFDGKICALGVSNFTIRHLSQLMECNHGVVPAVNQVEWHPYYNQPDLHNYCKEKKIQLQAYSPLGGSSCEVLLNDPTVQRIANALEVSPAQVLLVWSLQQDIAVIPKSVHPERLEENINVHFTLSKTDIKDLNALRVKNKKFSWDPTFVY